MIHLIGYIIGYMKGLFGYGQSKGRGAALASVKDNDNKVLPFRRK